MIAEMKYIHASTRCQFRGIKGLIIEDMEICAIGDDISDCARLRKDGKCKRGLE